MLDVYILKLEKERYYVGKCKKDFNDWIETYPIVKVERIIKKCDFYDIDKYTKMYMNIHGIDNARGGTYLEIELNEDTKNFLNKEFQTINNICTRCYFEKHLPRDCFVPSDSVCIKNLNLFGFVMKVEEEIISVLPEGYD